MRHTRIGEHFFDWAPLCNLRIPARYLWLALYAGEHAKHYPPGVQKLNIAGLCEEMHAGHVDVQNSLRELIDSGLVAHDTKTRVLLMTSLPDRGERPANGKVVWSFWRKWQALPDCDLKFLYLPIMHWLVGTIPTPAYQAVWDKTFGSVYTPVDNPVDNSGSEAADEPKPTQDTVSHTVSGLVSNPTKEADLSTGHLTNGSDSVGSGKVTLEHPSYPQPVDKLGTTPQTSMFSTPDDTVSDTVSHTVSYTVGKRVEGRGLGLESSGGVQGGRPRAGPKKTPFTVGELLDAVHQGSKGRVAVEPLDPRTGMELWHVVDICADAEVTLPDVTMAGEFLAAGHIGFRDDLDARWLTRSGVLLGLVAKARLWDAGGRVPLAKSGGRTPSQDRGPTAQDLAARAARLEAEGL